VGTDAQHPRGRGRPNPLAAPRRSTGQGHHARTKQAHQPDDHYDDYEESPWTRSRPSSLGPLYLLVRQLKWASSRWWTT
jgi:fatty acid desaturase